MVSTGLGQQSLGVTYGLGLVVFKHLLHDTKWEGECVAQKFPESNLLSICSNQGWLKHLQGGSKIASSGLEVADDMIFKEPKQLSWAAKSISSKS